MNSSIINEVRAEISGADIPDETARNMPEEDHNELQVYCAVLGMRLERRIARVETILLLLSAAAVFNALSLLLSR